MDAIYSIAIGLSLRFAVAIALPTTDAKISGTVIGLWEGSTLHHYTTKYQSSSDPYVAYAFRLLVDFIFTEDVLKLTVVMLWTGLGILLADVVPVLWIEWGLEKYWRRFRKHGAVKRATAMLARAPSPITANGNIGSSRGVHFEPPESIVQDVTPDTTPIIRRYTIRPSAQSTSFSVPTYKRPVPGAFTDTTSESGVTETPLPVPIPNAAHLRDISEENYQDEDGQRTPTQKKKVFAGVDPHDFELEYAQDREVLPSLDKVPEIPDDGKIPPEPQLSIPTFGPRPDIPPQPAAVIPIIDAGDIKKRVLYDDSKDDEKSEEIKPREGIPPQPTLEIPVFETTREEPIPPQPVVTLPEISPERPVSKALPDIPLEELAAAATTEELAAQGKRPTKRQTLPPAYADDWEHVENPDNKQKNYDNSQNLLGSKPFSSELESVPATDDDQFSIISADGKSGTISKAKLFREEARKEEKIAARLDVEAKEHRKNGQLKEAFLKQAEVDDALSRAKRLNASAARRYFHANNKDLSPSMIDVHGLKIIEAVRETEKALRDIIVQGGRELRVIVGQSKTEGKIPVLRATLMNRMNEQGIPTVVDKFNPGMLVISL